MLPGRVVASRLPVGLTAAAGLWCLAAILSPFLPGPDLGGLPVAAALVAGFAWLAVLARLRDAARASGDGASPSGAAEITGSDGAGGAAVGPVSRGREG